MSDNNEPKKIYLGDDKKIMGVCSGMAEYFNMDPTVVRLAAVALLFITGGSAAIAYLIAGVVMPKKPVSPQGPIEKS